MSYASRSFGSLTIVQTYKLTPEQLHLGITIGAQGNYEARKDLQAQKDWCTAVEIVKRKTPEENRSNCQLTDEEIRPVAEEVYNGRLERERQHFYTLATIHIKNEGANNPSHEEVLSRAEAIAEETRQAQQDEDWSNAERCAKKYGSVWFPAKLFEPHMK